MAERQEFPIRPTAPQATEQYSDISLTGLFSAHTAIVNSEQQAIWQRYNVMLLASAVIFGFLAGGVRTANEIIFGTIFGLILCGIWLIITRDGWLLLTMRRDRAAQFAWADLGTEANPFQTGVVYERGVPGGRIYQMAIAVIVLFAMAYMFLVARRLF